MGSLERCRRSPGRQRRSCSLTGAAPLDGQIATATAQPPVRVDNWHEFVNCFHLDQQQLQESRQIESNGSSAATLIQATRTIIHNNNNDTITHSNIIQSNKHLEESRATYSTHGNQNQDHHHQQQQQRHHHHHHLHCHHSTQPHPSQPECREYSPRPQTFRCQIDESNVRLRQRLPAQLPLSRLLVGDLIMKFYSILVMSTILSHLSYLQPNTISSLATTNNQQLIQHFINALPKINHVVGAEIKCATDSDCDNMDKVCHENKCICSRDKPIEDKDHSCLAKVEISEQCTITEQCLGNSECRDGTCSCGDDISIFNPSTKLHYCHTKSRLNEGCSHDAQCPRDAFCASSNSGCLCQNGFGQATIRYQEGNEALECLPKTCSTTSECESEFHECEDNKCKCLATHFDPNTAKCYKFGSTGGKPIDGSEQSDANKSNTNVTSLADSNDGGGGLYSILTDLTRVGDRLWIVILVLAIVSILFLIIIVMLIRRQCLGYCWARNKIEYAPNSQQAVDKNGYFKKDSIRNKSFRQKNGETDEVDDDTTAADRSNLVTASKSSNENNNKKTDGSLASRVAFTNSKSHYVKVDMNENDESHRIVGMEEKEQQREPKNSTTNGHHHYQPVHHKVVSPLASSTSTPV